MSEPVKPFASLEELDAALNNDDTQNIALLWQRVSATARLAFVRSGEAPRENDVKQKEGQRAANVYERELTKIADQGDVRITTELRARLMLDVLNDFLAARAAQDDGGR